MGDENQSIVIVEARNHKCGNVKYGARDEHSSSSKSIEERPDEDAAQE